MGQLPENYKYNSYNSVAVIIAIKTVAVYFTFRKERPTTAQINQVH